MFAVRFACRYVRTFAETSTMELLDASRIVYFIIVEPFSDASDQLISTSSLPAVGVPIVGAPGVVASVTGLDCVSEPVPIPFVAVTLKY